MHAHDDKKALFSPKSPKIRVQNTLLRNQAFEEFRHVINLGPKNPKFCPKKGGVCPVKSRFCPKNASKNKFQKTVTPDLINGKGFHFVPSCPRLGQEKS